MAENKPLFPTIDTAPITSYYGWRINPISGLPEFHAAIDISGGGVNLPIYATQNAIISEKRNTSYGGYTVRLQHTRDPYYSQYQHMNAPSPLSVGAVVTKGDVIGYMGTTGSSTGIHLDFAIAITPDGWFTEEGTIDPLVYLEMDFPPIPTVKKKMPLYMYLRKF